MHKLVKKFVNNLGLQALKVLGLKQYSGLLLNFFLCLPRILKQKNLAPVDKRMPEFFKFISVKHLGNKFRLNIQHIDNTINEEGSYAFSSVRELYIRNCYFRGHDNINTEEIEIVVDLGGNRGIFSTLCSTFCKRLIVVEPQSHYNSIVSYNIEQNGFDSKHYRIINAFIGQVDSNIDNASKIAVLPFMELMSNNSLDKIDFLKIDIEGAEFALFKEFIPLDKIKYISMEIHRDFGNVTEIIDRLKKADFYVATTDGDFNQTDNPDGIGFLYARNQKLISFQNHFFTAENG